MTHSDAIVLAVFLTPCVTLLAGSCWCSIADILRLDRASRAYDAHRYRLAGVTAVRRALFPGEGR